jgi:hypothetical protein
MTIDEQRKHQRFIPSTRTFVYTAESFGRILDISSGGFSLQYIDVESPIATKETVDIMLGDFTLAKVPITVVWGNEPGSQPASVRSIIMNKVGVKFGNLTTQQKATIDFFIALHTEGNA